VTIEEVDSEIGTNQPRAGRRRLIVGLALAGVALFTLVTYALIQTREPLKTVGFRDGSCTPGPLTESARNGEFTFQTSGLIDPQNESLVVSRSGARLGDRVESSLDQLDGAGNAGLIASTAEVRDAASNEVVFRVLVLGPAGEGCWRVDVSDARGKASYVVRVDAR
jgi:hypothetical protein